MTREEAIKVLDNYILDFRQPAMFEMMTALKLAIHDMLPTSPEQVEKVWRGEWQMISNGSGICSKCHRQDKIDPLAKFCRYCGAPMTDRAVQMVMERLEEIYK